MSNLTVQNRQSLKEAQAHIRKKIQSEWDAIRTKNPQLSRFEMKANTYCYQRRKPGFHLIINKLMDSIAYPAGYANAAGADRTQTKILTMTRDEFPSHNISANLWNAPLTKKQFTRMQQLAWNNFRPGIDLKGCKTLAQCKKRIMAVIHTKDPSFAFKATISADKDKVIVGKKVYHIEDRKSGGYVYPSIRVTLGKKRAWLRLDVLHSLLT